MFINKCNNPKRKVVFFTGLELSNQILNVKYVLQNNKEVKKHYKTV